MATRRRDAVLKLRLQADQKARWEKLAYAAGLNLSEWIRGMVDGTLTMSHAHTAAPEVAPAPKAPDLPVPPPTDKLAVARSLLGGDRQVTLAKLRGEPVESRAPVGRAPKAPAEVLREVRATAQANPGLNPVVLAERFVGRYPEHAEAIRAAVARLEDQTA